MEIPPPKEVGPRLRAAREHLGLKIPEVSERTGISTGNLSELERGQSYPSFKALYLLSDMYEIPVSWIMKGGPPPWEHQPPSGPEEDKEQNLASLRHFRSRLDDGDHYDLELNRSLDGLARLWTSSDEYNKGWIIVQIRRAFPDLHDNGQKKQRRATASSARDGA